MSTITTDNDFGGIKDMSQDLDIPQGDNEQVLAMAAFQNMGQAMADNDLYPPGEYKLHTYPGLFEIVVVKNSNTDYAFVTRVYNHVIEQYKKELQLKKQMAEANTDKEQGLVYDVPVWVVFELAMNCGVHPALDEKKFEEKLWEYFPECYIDVSKAPKRWRAK